MMIPALMIESRTSIPAFLMPTTKADEPAPDPPDVILGSLLGHVTPIARTEPI